MKTLYVCFLTLFFFISANAQKDWWEYSCQKMKGTDKFLIIENSREKADTVMTENQNVTTIVVSNTLIKTVIDTVTAPENIDEWDVRYLYFNKQDSSRVEEVNSLVYIPENLYMKKIYKDFKKYAYYDKEKKSIYTRDFYRETTETSSGVIVLYLFFLLVPFSAKLLRNVWNKKQLEHQGAQKKRFSKLFWRIMFATPIIGSIPFALFGVSDGTAANAFWMCPIATLVLLMCFAFLDSNDDFDGAGFIFFIYLAALCVIGVYLHSWTVFTVCVVVSILSFFLGKWVSQILIKRIENTALMTEITQAS